MEGKAGAGGFINKEEEAGAGGDEDLGMVAALGEEPVTLVEGGFEVGGVFDGVAEDRGAKGVEGAGGSVDDDEAVVGEKRREEAGEGAGEGGLRRVGGGEEVEFGSATDELGGAIEDLGDIGAEGEIADGAGGGDGVKIETQGMEGMAGGEGDVVSFGEVVVFRGEPEDGDTVRVLGAADDGSGFEEGEERSGEEGDLLAGDDGARSLPAQANGRLEWGIAGAEALDVGEGFGASGLGPGKPGLVLFDEEVGEAVAVGGVACGDGGGPVGGPGSGGEEGGEGFAARGVVEEEPALPGEERDGVTVDLHGRT